MTFSCAINEVACSDRHHLSSGQGARARVRGTNCQWWMRSKLRRTHAWARMRRHATAVPCAAGEMLRLGSIVQLPGMGSADSVTPLLALGPAGIESWAEHLTRILAEFGIVRFTEEQISMLRRLVDEEFGAGSGTQLSRVEALVWRLTQGRVYEKHVRGQGKQFAASYIEGLCPDSPFHDAVAFPWCATLAAHANVILEDLRDAKPDMWARAGKALEGKMYAPEWRIIGLVQAGIWVTDSFRRTKQVLCSLSGLRPYEILFARMPARTKIGAHSDNMNYIITAHLGLDLEEGACYIRVGDQARQWRIGKVIVFDTSYVHSAANDSDKDRFILLIRFWHPDISNEERFALMSQLSILNAMRKREQASKLFQAQQPGQTH